MIPSGKTKSKKGLRERVRDKLSRRDNASAEGDEPQDSPSGTASHDRDDTTAQDNDQPGLTSTSTATMILRPKLQEQGSGQNDSEDQRTNDSRSNTERVGAHGAQNSDAGPGSTTGGNNPHQGQQKTTDDPTKQHLGEAPLQSFGPGAADETLDAASDYVPDTAQDELPAAALDETPSQAPDEDIVSDLLSLDEIWTKAGEKLREEDEELATAYQNDLLALQGTPVDCPPEQKQKRLQQKAQQSLGALEQKRWKLTLGNKEIALREQTERMLKSILAVKDIIGAVMAANPVAAQAWGGVMAVVPFIDSMLQQDEEAASAFEGTVNLLLRCNLVHDNHFYSSITAKGKQSSTTHRLLVSLQGKFVQAFCQVLVCQIRIVRQYARGGLYRNIRDLIVADGWKEKLDELQKTEIEINKDVQVLTNNTMSFTALDVQALGSKVEEMERTQKATLTAIEEGELTRLLNSIPKADGAAYDSHTNATKISQCHAGTSLDKLALIENWILGVNHVSVEDDPDNNENEPLVLWMHGMAGTGKSTICKTVASALAKQRYMVRTGELGDDVCLAASFFFNRLHQSRNNARLFVTTIARFLALRVPALKESILAAFRPDSNGGQDIKNSALLIQWDTLVVRPLQKLDKEVVRPVKLFIVVDALDECKETEVSQVIQCFRTIPAMNHVQLRVLVLSRLEQHIADAFQRRIPRQSEGDVNGRCAYRSDEVRKVPLAEINKGETDDILRVLEFELDRIRQDRDFEPQWPGRAAVVEIHRQSGGLWIYASTAWKFLDHVQGEDSRLELLLDNVVDTGTPNGNLDQIYGSILRSVLDGSKRPSSELAAIRKIISCTVSLRVPSSIATIAALCSEKPRRVTNYLNELRSFLSVPGPQDLSSPVELIHLSFRDFLVDQSRCLDLVGFHVDVKREDERLARRCLEILSSEDSGLYQDMCGLREPGIAVSDVAMERIHDKIPEVLRYACRYWGDHLLRLSHENIDDTDSPSAVEVSLGLEVYEFVLTKYLFWLEAMSLLGILGQCLVLVRRLQTMRFSPKDMTENLSAILYDATRFLMRHRHIMDSHPLQIYLSALLLSPEKSIIRRQNLPRLLPRWVTQVPRMESTWSHELMSLPIRHGPNEAVFSARGNRLCTRDGAGQVTVWDTFSWDVKGKVDQNDEWEEKIVLSHDGRVAALLSLGVECALKLWNIDTNESSQYISPGQTSIATLAFSCDSTRLVCLLMSGQLWLLTPDRGQSASPSTNGWHSRLISGLDAFQSPFYPEIASGQNIAAVAWFREDEQTVLQVHVWITFSDIPITHSILPSHTRATFESFCLSSDGHRLAAVEDICDPKVDRGNRYPNVTVWDTKSGAQRGYFPLDHLNLRGEPHLSNNGRLVVPGYRGVTTFDIISNAKADRLIPHLGKCDGFSDEGMVLADCNVYDFKQKDSDFTISPLSSSFLPFSSSDATVMLDARLESDDEHRASKYGATYTLSEDSFEALPISWPTALTDKFNRPRLLWNGKHDGHHWAILSHTHYGEDVVLSLWNITFSPSLGPPYASEQPTSFVCLSRSDEWVPDLEVTSSRQFVLIQDRWRRVHVWQPFAMGQKIWQAPCFNERLNNAFSPCNTMIAFYQPLTLTIHDSVSGDIKHRFQLTDHCIVDSMQRVQLQLTAYGSYLEIRNCLFLTNQLLLLFIAFDGETGQDSSSETDEGSPTSEPGDKLESIALVALTLDPWDPHLATIVAHIQVRYPSYCVITVSRNTGQAAIHHVDRKGFEMISIIRANSPVPTWTTITRALSNRFVTLDLSATFSPVGDKIAVYMRRAKLMRGFKELSIDIISLDDAGVSRQLAWSDCLQKFPEPPLWVYMDVLVWGEHDMIAAIISIEGTKAMALWNATSCTFLGNYQLYGEVDPMGFSLDGTAISGSRALLPVPKSLPAIIPTSHKENDAPLQVSHASSPTSEDGHQRSAFFHDSWIRDEQHRPLIWMPDDYEYPRSLNDGECFMMLHPSGWPWVLKLDPSQDWVIDRNKPRSA